MKKKTITSFRKIISIAVVMLIYLNGKAQVIDELKSGLTNYQRHHIIEKIFVHVNKDFFVAGEIVWFKLYCVDGATNKPIDMSKVAYLELLDSKNTPVLQTKTALKHAAGYGSMYLPSTLPSGSYTLRAYTNWMKNFGTDGFFEQQITVINLLQATVALQKKVDDYDVQFMPEGGNLVNGLPGKVAVKVIGTNGLGAVYTGALLDQKNDTVARFAPFKFGIGSFNFTPLAGQVYKAIIKVKGKTINKTLPNITQSGYTIHAEDKGSSWNISIARTNNAAANDLYMLIHNSAGVISAVNLKGLSAYTINKAQLKDGINIITLFNSQRQPVCERLIFKRPAIKFQILAKTDASVYEQRQKVTLTINTAAQNVVANAAGLSLSIYKTDSLQKAGAASIDRYLWLSSEVKGDVESPEYYLTPSADADMALDNLLLAQGWRTFNWAAATTSANYKFAYLPEYAGNIVTANITGKSSGLPAKNITAYLSIPDTLADRLFTAVSDSTGKLQFNIGYAYGNHEVVLQTNHFIDTALYRFELNNPFSTAYPAPKLIALAPVSPSQVDDYGLSMLVQNAYHAKDTRSFLTPFIDTLSFYGTPRKSFLLDNFTRFTTMEEVLEEYVTFVENVRRRGKLYVSMFNQDALLTENPLVTIDGVPLFDNSKIYSIDPLKIKKINVLNKRYFQGAARYESLLALTSKKGDFGGFELDPRAIILDYKGLQEQRQFYSPVYDTPAKQASRLPDYRNALYWNPDITTDESGVTTITCYTSDLSGKYYGIIQGIDSNGTASSAHFTFDVK